MSLSYTTTITVLISIILATSAFLVVTINQPIPATISTAEQAIDILKESSKTDHRIINGSSPVSAELEYVSLNLTNYIKINSNEHPHSRIYVSATPAGEIKQYWFVCYETTWDDGWSSGSGKYILDAQTGELILSLERISGDISVIGPDYLLSLQPDGWVPNSPIEMKMYQSTPIILTLTAEPGYEASLPVSMNVTGVPDGLRVIQNATSTILKTGGSVSFLLQVAPVAVAHEREHIDFEISFIGITKPYSIFVRINQ